MKKTSFVDNIKRKLSLNNIKDKLNFFKTSKKNDAKTIDKIDERTAFFNEIKRKQAAGELDYDEETGLFFGSNNNNLNRNSNINRAVNQNEMGEEENILKVIKMSGSDEIIFKRVNGNITRQYNLGGSMGKENIISEEEYNSYSYITNEDRSKSAYKELGKEKDNDMELG